MIDGFNYTYDADNNVTSKTNLVLSADSETYGYDNLNRLTSFTRGTTTSESWNYNALGDWNSETVNGVTTSRNNNAQNQAYNISGSTLTYDADGNTLSNQVTGQTYVYDAWNHLVAVKNTSGAVIASYTYDAIGRRITQTEGGVTIDLYYSNEGQVIEEQQAGVTVAQYVWSPFYVNQLVQKTNSHGTFYVQQDANYNVTSISNSSGSIVERYVYDPYGQVTVLTASGVILGIGMTSSLFGEIVGYQGGWTDPISGLIHFDARDLNPWTGQWNTQDPTGAMYVNGPALGQVEVSNPISFLDPSSLQSWYQGWGSASWVLLGGYGGEAAGRAWVQGNVETQKMWDQAGQAAPIVPDALATAQGAADFLASGGADDEVGPELSKDLEDLENMGSQPQSSSSSSSTPPAQPSSTSQPPATPAQPTSPAQPANPGEPAEPPGSGSGDSDSQPSDCPDTKAGDRYSGRYSDGQRAYRTNVPRDGNNNPIPDPDATGAHSRLQPDARDPSRIYSATEFDDNGQAVKRTDFAGRSGDTLPHEHPYDPNTQGFGPKQPLNNGN